MQMKDIINEILVLKIKVKKIIQFRKIK